MSVSPDLPCLTKVALSAGMGLDSNCMLRTTRPSHCALTLDPSSAVPTLDVAPRPGTVGAVDLTDKTTKEHVYSAYKVWPFDASGWSRRQG